MKPIWWQLGLGLALLVGLVALLVQSTVPRMPGMTITGGMPMDGNGNPNGRMPGMTMPMGKVATRDAHALALLPSGQVFFGHHDGVQRFDPQPGRWSDALRQTDYDAMNLAWDGERLIVAGHGVYAESRDLSLFRDLKPRGLPGDDLHGYAVNPSDPRQHYLWEVVGGLYRSDDGGATWQGLAGRGLPRGVHTLAVDGENRLYAGGAGLGLYRSSDGGRSFAPVDPPETDVLAMSVGADWKLYVGGRRGLYVQGEGGWQRLESSSVLALTSSPSEAGYVVWLDGSGRVWQR
ncbi:MAG: S-layer protein [Meiothermus sp.]|nr:S-layer protein [Meiothermus sp.]